MSAWLPWIKFAILLAFPFIVLAAIDKAKSLGWLSPHCPECRTAMNVETKTLKEPTSEENGLGLSLRICPQCGYREEKQFLIQKYYQGPRKGIERYSLWLVWKRQPWKSVTKEALDRVEKDSASGHGNGNEGERR